MLYSKQKNVACFKQTHPSPKNGMSNFLYATSSLLANVEVNFHAMPGPAHKSGSQKCKEKKKRELARALQPNNDGMTNCFQSAQKTAPSQTEEESRVYKRS